MGTLRKFISYSKGHRYFQFEFCVITPKILLSNLSWVRVFNCSRYFWNEQLCDFNINRPVEKTDMGLNDKKVCKITQNAKSSNISTVKPVLSGHSKIDKTKVLMTNGSLVKVKSIAECSDWSILQYFWPAFSDNQYWKPIFGVHFEWPLKTGFTV